MVYIDPKDESGTATLIGIVSWMAACGQREWPSIHGRVSHVMDWIHRETGKYQLVQLR